MNCFSDDEEFIAYDEEYDNHEYIYQNYQQLKNNLSCKEIIKDIPIDDLYNYLIIAIDENNIDIANVIFEDERTYISHNNNKIIKHLCEFINIDVFNIVLSNKALNIDDDIREIINICEDNENIEIIDLLLADCQIGLKSKIEICLYFPSKYQEYFQSIINNHQNNDIFKIVCENGYINILEILMNRNDFCPSINENYGLIMATAANKFDIVKLLLTDKQVFPSTNNNLALNIAYENGYNDILNLALNIAYENGYNDILNLYLNDLRTHIENLSGSLKDKAKSMKQCNLNKMIFGNDKIMFAILKYIKTPIAVNKYIYNTSNDDEIYKNRLMRFFNQDTLNSVNKNIYMSYYNPISEPKRFNLKKLNILREVIFRCEINELIMLYYSDEDAKILIDKKENLRIITGYNIKGNTNFEDYLLRYYQIGLVPEINMSLIFMYGFDNVAKKIIPDPTYVKTDEDLYFLSTINNYEMMDWIITNKQKFISYNSIKLIVNIYIETGYDNLIYTLLKSAKLMDSLYWYNETLLYLFDKCLEFQNQMIEFVLENGKELNKYMELACVHENIEIIKRLLILGATNFVDCMNKSTKHIDIVLLLIDDDNFIFDTIDICNNAGLTVSTNGDCHTLKILIEKGATMLSQFMKLAITNKHEKIINYLISLDKFNSDDYELFLQSCLWHYPRIFDCLIAKGAIGKNISYNDVCAFIKSKDVENLETFKKLIDLYIVDQNILANFLQETIKLNKLIYLHFLYSKLKVNAKILDLFLEQSIICGNSNLIEFFVNCGASCKNISYNDVCAFIKSKDVENLETFKKLIDLYIVDQNILGRFLQETIKFNKLIYLHFLYSKLKVNTKILDLFLEQSIICGNSNLIEFFVNRGASGKHVNINSIISFIKFYHDKPKTFKQILSITDITMKTEILNEIYYTIQKDNNIEYFEILFEYVSKI